MQYFLYKVKDDTGRALYGVAPATDSKNLKKRFRDTEFYFLSARPVSEKFVFNRKLTLDQLLMFNQRFLSLIEAGIPILSALNILWKQSDNKDVQIITSHIINRLEDGANLYEALEDFPKVFPVMYRVMISVSELGAGLVIVLQKLTQYLEKQREMVVRAKKAVLYPSIVMGFSILVLLVMFIFVVPTFQKVLSKLDVKLPLLTQILLSISLFLRSIYFPIFLVVSGTLLFVGYKSMKTNKHTAYLVDSFKLKIPLLKHIFYTMSVSRFVRAMSLLIGAGIPIIESINVAKKTTLNQKIEAAVDKIKDQVIDGNSLYTAFKSVKTFPLILVEMIGIGETSGNLVQLMEKSSVHFENELDYFINKFLTYLEPILIVFVGGAVGLIMAGIYLPILSLWSGLSNI